MRRITMLLTFALFTPACDEPEQTARERVYIEMSADNADIFSEDGELIRSVAPDELSLVLEDGEQVSTDSPDDLTVVPDEPEQANMRCFACGWPIPICVELVCQQK